MLEIVKTDELKSRNIPFGVVEVKYPELKRRNIDDFRALAEREISAARENNINYDRKAVFGENHFFRFFRKFKKTYPVLLQFESIIVKGQPFPVNNPVTEVPYLLELTTCMLSGTHDAEQVKGKLELSSGTGKLPFIGMHGREIHTYPGDVVGRDDEGIILSEIAGADDRTCARDGSSHVFYPVFGTPDMPVKDIESAIEKLRRYISVLSPEAEVESQIL